MVSRFRPDMPVLVAAALILAGCTSGTTYGTGVTHEQQTLEGLSNILSLKGKDQPNIDYAARPDLVMPADKNALPQPLETAATTSDGDWPETPEQRIARVRGEAVEPHERSGELPVEELLRKKDGLRVKKARIQDHRNGDGFIEAMKQDAAGNAEGSEVRKRRAELAYATGPKRKYLTEPPVEYRTPAATAAAGDLGYDEEELKALEEKRKQEEESERRGMWTQ